MIANTKNRLLLVTFGFIRIHTDITCWNRAPIAIIELCSKWILQLGQNDISIKFYKYYCDTDSVPMTMELSLDDNDKSNCDINFFDKIFDNRLIQKYEINYISSYNNNSKNFVEFESIELQSNLDSINKEFIEKKIESGLLSSVIAPVRSINDPKCFAFIFPRVITDDIDTEMLVQVNALDANDCILLSSKWRTMYVSHDLILYYGEDYNNKAVEKYWKEYIVDNRYKMEKKNNNCVILNEWINSMKKLEIITDEYNARLIFWFILFNNKSSLNEMKVEDLKEFIYDPTFEEYAPQFHHPIGNFRKVISNLLYTELSASQSAMLDENEYEYPS